MQCTLHAVQLSQSTFNAVHEALVRHFAEQLSHSTHPFQQVVLHESLVGHFTIHLSQSTDTSQQVALHEALGHFAEQLSQSTDTYISKWHCMKLLWGTLHCNSRSHQALTHLSKWHCMNVLWVWDTFHHNLHTTLREYGHA